MSFRAYVVPSTMRSTFCGFKHFEGDLSILHDEPRSVGGQVSKGKSSAIVVQNLNLELLRAKLLLMLTESSYEVPLASHRLLVSR